MERLAVLGGWGWMRRRLGVEGWQGWWQVKVGGGKVKQVGDERLERLVMVGVWVGGCKGWRCKVGRVGGGRPGA